jgi:hypothetical protein
VGASFWGANLLFFDCAQRVGEEALSDIRLALSQGQPLGHGDPFGFCYLWQRMGDRRMSLLLFLFYWVVIPALVIAVAAWLWQRMRSPAARGLVGIACIATLSGLLWLAVGEKWLADRQVRELCAKDGGVRVYETVKLPTDQYEQYAKKNWILPDKSQMTSSDEYYADTDVHYYQQGILNMSRRQYRIIRSSDSKVLGESISYGRSGGDLPGPWHHSSFKCPDPVKQPSNIETTIFLRALPKRVSFEFFEKQSSFRSHATGWLRLCLALTDPRTCHDFREPQSSSPPKLRYFVSR